MNLPARVGSYRPIRHLGTGGMGTVYYAVDPDGGRPLAIKVLHQDFAADPEHRARFRRESAMLRKVTGPYLVPLVDADPEAPLPWLATAYVHGNTLHQHVRVHGAMSPDNLLTFAAAVAHALACIHDAGIAHRDLKPTNVLLAADGPRVVDFGIAHHLDATAITATSVTTGTPGWMAPEQLTDGTTLPACDIFAWGLLVAYAAAAAHPFGTPTGITHRIVSSAPSLKGVPDVLLPLVRSALHKEPGQRPRAEELARRTAAVYGPTGTAVFPTVSYTRILDHGARQSDAEADGTVPLDRARWNVPLPTGHPSDEETAAPPVSSEPSRAKTSGEPTPAATARTVRRVPPAPLNPPVSVPPPPASKPSPAGPAPARRHERRRIFYGLAIGAVVGAAVGSVLTGVPFGDTGTGAAGRHTGADTTAEPKQAVPSPEGPATTSAADESPDTQEAVAEQEPEPEPVAVFGGLRVTVPTDSKLMLRSSDEATDPGSDRTKGPSTATRVDFSLHGDSGTGVRIMYSPDLTVDRIREGHLESGAMWSVANDDSGSSTDESVISVKDGPLTGVGGKNARHWTIGTDVLPDYDGSRRNSHRVWWLPYSRYLIYTYGKHDKTTDAAVDELIRSTRFEATKMPRDCADAVVALDKTARSGELADDHGTLANCRDAAVNGRGQLDPGTVDTKSEAACVALADAYGGYGVDLGYDEAKAYKELRPWCDVPGAVSNPNLPDGGRL
ncbi:serine/threonine-protein kinase [Streptomyces sp. HYC2]|uniref:serine/threonine protein kinase n=1 Tax=Streptomyces sp. HYC2 TaxID=2955207 RepID=UPI002480DA93|nr:serine/threonine-protein kinase [Streptomyces sp. HYC2]